MHNAISSYTPSYKWGFPNIDGEEVPDHVESSSLSVLNLMAVPTSQQIARDINGKVTNYKYSLLLA